MNDDEKFSSLRDKKYFYFFVTLMMSTIIILPLTYYVYLNDTKKNECSVSKITSFPSAIGGEFTLKDIQNKRQHSSQIITNPSIIYFGYSFCPDVCPFDLQRNVIAVDILASQGLEVTPIFITIDPMRDTPSRLKEFSEFVHPKLIALTGSQSEIDAAMQTFKVYGQKAPTSKTDLENYLMDHSAFTYLVSSSNKFIDFFKRQVTPQEMAERINCLLNKNSIKKL